MTDEEELARRLHNLVDSPPAGRDLATAVRRASARRRARLAATGSGLGVTAVVVGGAATAGLFDGSSASAPVPVGSGVASALASLRTAAPVDSTPAPAVTVAASAVVTVAPRADTVKALRSALYYYVRVIGESDGSRETLSSWTGHAGSKIVENDDPVAGKGSRTAVSTSFHGEWQQTLTWDDFSSVPSAARLHFWVWGGSTRADLAFKQAGDLLFGTPTTPAFRLAVLAEEKRVPGVVTTYGVKDVTGRTGDRLRLGRRSYVISAKDGSLLQQEYLADAACSGDAAQVEWRTIYLESGVVPDTHSVLAAAPVTLTDKLPGPCS